MAERKGRRRTQRTSKGARGGSKRTARESQRTPSRGTAPSSPDLEHLEKMEASEEAKAHKPSDVDAMGRDKRRQVVGHAYGPSKRSQILFFVAVGALAVLLVGGSMAAVSAFDQPPDEYPDEAPWSASDAEQIPTRDPSGPCGEPGNAYPFPQDSPCVTGRTSTDEPPAAGSERSEASTAAP